MFDFKPTSANADTLLDMYIELTDLNESDPQSVKYDFQVYVSDIFVFTQDVKETTEEDLEVIRVQVVPADYNGLLWI